MGYTVRWELRRKADDKGVPVAASGIRWVDMECAEKAEKTVRAEIHQNQYNNLVSADGGTLSFFTTRD